MFAGAHTIDLQKVRLQEVVSDEQVDLCLGSGPPFLTKALPSESLNLLLYK